MFQIVLAETPDSPSRAEVMEKLTAEGISTGVHYPAIHLFTLYRAAGWKDGDFPHAELAGRKILTLPLFPTLTSAEVERVATTFIRVLKSFQ
jgi:dTDP-4-amino-4,6-dideoxygalactose transaminase